MSYDDEERRREYNREQDRREEERARQRRQDEERARQDDENRRLERQRDDRKREEGMAAIRKGDLAGGAAKLGMLDFSIDYLQSQSVSEAEVAGDDLQSQSPRNAGVPSTDTEVYALDLLSSSSGSQHPLVQSILRETSFSIRVKFFLALPTLLSVIEEKKRIKTRELDELNRRILVSTEEMVRRNYLNIDKHLLEAELGGLDTEKFLLQSALDSLNKGSNAASP